jgi:hypothetical protein
MRAPKQHKQRLSKVFAGIFLLKEGICPDTLELNYFKEFACRKVDRPGEK